MSWSPPQTWVTSQLVTAADLNTDLRDNLNYLYDRSNWDSHVGLSTFNFSSTSYAQVGTLSVSLTTIGNPVLLMLELTSLRVSNAAYHFYVRWYNATSTSYIGSEYYTRNVDRTPATLMAVEQPSAGTYTWHIRAKVDDVAATGTLVQPTLHAIELL